MSYINLERCSVFFGPELNINNPECKKVVTSPKGLLEFIINFFTFGWVKRELSKEYEGLIFAMTASIEEKTDSSNYYKIPKEINFSFNKHRITVEPSNFNKDSVSIRVEDKKGGVFTSEINKKISKMSLH